MKKVTLSVLALLSISFLKVHAFVLQNPIGCGTFGCVATKILNGLFWIALPLVSVAIMIGAFQILFSAGNEEMVKTGRKTIWYAVIGLFIALMASSAPSLFSSFF